MQTMDKKHELYVKLPVYFGYAAILIPFLIVVLVQFGAPDWVCYVVFFIGFACTIAGLMAAGMKEGQSEEDRRYCRPGVIICLIMIVIYIIIIWFYVTLVYPLIQILM